MHPHAKHIFFVIVIGAFAYVAFVGFVVLLAAFVEWWKDGRAKGPGSHGEGGIKSRRFRGKGV